MGSGIRWCRLPLMIGRAGFTLTAAGVVFGAGEIIDEQQRSGQTRQTRAPLRVIAKAACAAKEYFKPFPIFYEPLPSQRSKMRVGFTRMAVAAAGGIDRVESCAALLAVARRIREGTHSPKPTPPSEEAETREPHSAFAAKT
jgi:hypothetical protein